MSAGSNEQLTELVRCIAAEQNPIKLKELVKQLNHLLTSARNQPSQIQTPLDLIILQKNQPMAPRSARCPICPEHCFK